MEREDWKQDADVKWLRHDAMEAIVFAFQSLGIRATLESDESSVLDAICARCFALGQASAAGASAVAEASPAIESDAEAHGTFACSVCGIVGPHYHDRDEVNNSREAAAYFEGAMEQIRAVLNNHPWNGTRNHNLPMHWYARSTDPNVTLNTPSIGYKDPFINALWKLWLRAYNIRRLPYNVKAGVPADGAAVRDRERLEAAIEAVIQRAARLICVHPLAIDTDEIQRRSCYDCYANARAKMLPILAPLRASSPSGAPK